MQQSVTVVGYPTGNQDSALLLPPLSKFKVSHAGGDNVSVTKGVVSRVLVWSYSHSHELLLSIQVDAAINPGNSGGPVLQGVTARLLFLLFVLSCCLLHGCVRICCAQQRKVVGVAFQHHTSAQNIGAQYPLSSLLLCPPGLALASR